MGRLNPVVHQNFVTEENGYSVFCKRLHKVDKIFNLNETCFNCPYLYGLLQGEGVECGWEDCVAEPFLCVIDPEKERERVSGLIQKGILKKW